MKKANEQKTVEALEHVIQHIQQHYPDIQLIVEASVADELGIETRQQLVVAERGAFELPITTVQVAPLMTPP